jgi:hypothetical protein
MIWKAKQGQMQSVFDEGTKRQQHRKENETISKNPIPEFEAMSRHIIETIKNELDDNEVRAMAADKVACPTLKVESLFFLSFDTRSHVRYSYCWKLKQIKTMQMNLAP